MATEAGGPLRHAAGAGRGPRAVDGRRAGLGAGASRSRGGRGGGRGGTARRSPRSRRRCWSRWPAWPPCSPCRPRPTAASSRPTPNWRSPTTVTKANADLKSANVREKQRFDLAMEAIKLFHGEVGDDLVLKADQFKPLRDKLLEGRGRLLRQARRACSRISPTGPRARRWGMPTSSSAI